MVTLLSAAASALSLLFSTPLLSRGRKKVLLAGVLGTALTNVPFITISAGYLSLSPDLPPVINSEKVVVALIIGLTLLNLLGLDDLPLLSCRVLLNDQSSANERTRNLNVSVHFAFLCTFSVSETEKAQKFSLIFFSTSSSVPAVAEHQLSERLVDRPSLCICSLSASPIHSRYPVASSRSRLFGQRGSIPPGISGQDCSMVANVQST